MCGLQTLGTALHRINPSILRPPIPMHFKIDYLDLHTVISFIPSADSSAEIPVLQFDSSFSIVPTKPSMIPSAVWWMCYMGISKLWWD
jgi:hypothetical protein